MQLEIHCYHHWAGLDLTPVLAKLDAILSAVQAQGVKMGDELAALEAQVSANTSAEESAVLLLGQLHELLVTAQSSGDPARLQAVIDALGTSKEKLAAAILANAVPS